LEFIEAPIFSKIIHKYLDDDEYATLQWEMALHPETGDLIPSSAGLRKLRWSSKGHGKRGGARIIYYYNIPRKQIWLITIYSKNEYESIPLDTLKKIREKLGI